MEQFKNVTINKKPNIYFEGNVVSYTVLFGNVERKTIGIMMPGEYEFGTEDKEIMEILGGTIDVLLPGRDQWETIIGGESFEVPSNSSFKVVIKELSEYCCSYVKEQE